MSPGYWRRIVASYTEGRHTFGPLPQFFTSGNLYDVSTQMQGQYSTHTFNTARLTYFAPFIVPINSIFGDVAISVSVVVAGAVASIGLYRSAFSAVDTSTNTLELVASLGTIGMGLSGFQYVGLPQAIQINQGFYFLAIETDRITPAIAGLVGNASNRIASYGYSPFGSAITPDLMLTGDNTGVTFGQWSEQIEVFSTSGSIPRIFLQYVERAPGAP